ncbi:tryptophanase [Paraburkholderia monticola]|nr:tryptophanase [Paraburkholderia monticola]
MAKRVTFVNTNQIKPAIAPIAFDYLSAPMERAGFELDLLDLCFSDDCEAAIAAHCRTAAPAYWGVTLRNTDDVYFSSGYSFLDRIRDIVAMLRRVRAVPVVMGGAGYSVMPEKLLAYLDADFGIVREGEFSFPELLTCLEEGRSFTHIPGLVYRDAAGVHATPLAPNTCGPLAKIGPHKRELVDNPHYFAKGGQIGIETKRGCNRSCIYCVEPLIKGRTVRMREPDDVVAEMASLVEQGVNVFHINDSEFNLSVAHPLALCAAIVRHGLAGKIQWYAYGMPKPFPDELAAAMKAAGCVGMNFGVDSASETMLKILRRTFSAADIEHAVKTAKRHGLEHIIELLFGAPGETRETARETIEFIKRVDPERVSVTVGLRIFPGTELEQMIREEGLNVANPNLHGQIEGNDDLLHPVFYLPTALGPEPQKFIADLIGNDRRFFGTNTSLFNYNANDALVEAIAQGERGAYWSILNRIEKRFEAAHHNGHGGHCASAHGGEPEWAPIARVLSTQEESMLSDDSPPEPYRIKMVEPIRLIDREQRQARLAAAGYNVFRLEADDVYIDLMTDSGTSAMSANQWAGIMTGDESYAGSRSFTKLTQSVRDMLGFEYVLPTHQGRPAEHFLFRTLVRPGQVVPFNAPFDSTEAHVSIAGGTAIPCVGDIGYQPAVEHPFKGDVDVQKLRNVIESEGRDNVPLIMVSLTNNAGGGQPVSMANLRAVRALADEFAIPVYFDAARCAENAYFIQQRESGYASRSVADILKEQFSYAEGCTFSCKKDALVNIGGLLATRSRTLYEQVVPLLVLHEGFVTYGGMAGRDLEALSIGLREMVDDDYLQHRVRQVERLGDRLLAGGVPILRPTGGHAVYVDAAAFLPHLPRSEFPAEALAAELYLEGGVRAVGLGSLAFLKEDPSTGTASPPRLELLRLAIPRRVYTDSHLGAVAAALIRVYHRRAAIPGMRIVSAPPMLKHFTAVLAPIEVRDEVLAESGEVMV